jgi:hypothetical protein
VTTIAYKDGIMAADAQISANGFVHSSALKIVRNARGDLCGASGNQGFMVRFLSWFEKGEKGEPPSAQDKDEHYDVIIIRARKPHQALTINQTTLCPISGEFYAIGSGRSFALGAMMAGADAMFAVQIACKMDNYSGGDIVALSHKGDLVMMGAHHGIARCCHETR